MYNLVGQAVSLPRANELFALKRSIVPFEYQSFYRRHLPHFQPVGATLFITFRLADSLPLEVIQRLESEARNWEIEMDRMRDPLEQQRAAYLVERQLFDRWDEELDQNFTGPHWLSEPAVAELVCEALHYRDCDFWQHESYDHVVRDPHELERIVEYVMMNPVRAGLPERWFYRKAN